MLGVGMPSGTLRAAPGQGVRGPRRCEPSRTAFPRGAWERGEDHGTESDPDRTPPSASGPTLASIGGSEYSGGVVRRDEPAPIPPPASPGPRSFA